MMKHIFYNSFRYIQKLFIVFYFFAFLLSATTFKRFDHNPQIKIKLAPNKILKTRMALTFEEQMKGFSGIKPEHVKDDQALLFFYNNDDFRSFWMVDTYFDLDIIFLDKDFKVLHIERNMPAHPGRSDNPPIKHTKTVWARHVLEMKSSSPLAKLVKVGDFLRQIKAKTHH